MPSSSREHSPDTSSSRLSTPSLTFSGRTIDPSTGDPPPADNETFRPLEERIQTGRAPLNQSLTATCGPPTTRCPTQEGGNQGDDGMQPQYFRQEPILASSPPQSASEDEDERVPIPSLSREGDGDERMRSPSLPQESDFERIDQGSHSGQVTEAEHPSTPDVSRGPGALWDGSPLASPLGGSSRGAQAADEEDEEMEDQ